MCSASGPKATTKRSRLKQRRYNDSRWDQKDEGQALAIVRHDNLILAVLAVVIGTVVGWAVAGILTLMDLIQSIRFGSGGDHRANIVWVLPT